ncbi:maker692 [Drosophila busckii]|uniref:Maker692 n=1 Tax=Drosophila busckii TaxID=30019 RepID=A0A0M4EKQ2_DROBS|nr:hrp65 protein [Drosophila busckii]ALC43872.1 maker692 [Drosophila busckii]
MNILTAFIFILLLSSVWHVEAKQIKIKITLGPERSETNNVVRRKGWIGPVMQMASGLLGGMGGGAQGGAGGEGGKGGEGGSASSSSSANSKDDNNNMNKLNQNNWSNNVNNAFSINNHATNIRINRPLANKWQQAKRRSSIRFK